MREPVFDETVQLRIVVRDLEATVRRYENEYGIGPWQFAQIDAGEANNYREYSRPGDVGAYRVARRGRHLRAFLC